MSLLFRQSTDDVLYILKFNKTTKLFNIESFENVRESKTAIFEQLQASPGDNCSIIVLFVSKNSKYCSKPFIYNFQIQAGNISNITFGLLYNYWARAHSNFVPSGWHLPTNAEFDELLNFSDPEYTFNCARLRSTDSNLFEISQDSQSLDLYGLKLSAPGIRLENGTFINFKKQVQLASSDLFEESESEAYICAFDYDIDSTGTGGSQLGKSGISVRFIKNDSVLPENNILTDFDGNIYECVKLGNQVWMKQNYACTHFTDGSDIPLVELSQDWADLETPGYCYPNANILNV